MNFVEMVKQLSQDRQAQSIILEKATKTRGPNTFCPKPYTLHGHRRVYEEPGAKRRRFITIRVSDLDFVSQWTGSRGPVLANIPASPLIFCRAARALYSNS
jgi:hypothetical protein